jgi:hypothetical protein
MGADLGGCSAQYPPAFRGIWSRAPGNPELQIGPEAALQPDRLPFQEKQKIRFVATNHMNSHGRFALGTPGQGGNQADLSQLGGQRLDRGGDHRYTLPERKSQSAMPPFSHQHSRHATSAVAPDLAERNIVNEWQ